LSKSGSRRAVRPPELAAWQDRALRAVSESDIAPELTFGGGAALAAIHLHHRTSEDLDFFLTRPLDPLEVEQVGRTIATKTTRVDIEVVGPRTSLVLRRVSGPFGRIDFAYYPFDPIGRRTSLGVGRSALAKPVPQLRRVRGRDPGDRRVEPRARGRGHP
jgi:hypothetical protein